MEKFLKLTMIFLVALLAPTLSACSDDDDDSDQNSSELVGVWADLDDMESDYSSWSAYQFNSDGTGLTGQWDPTKKKFVHVSYELTWSITSSGRLIIYYLVYDDTWIPNYIVNGDYLYLWDDREEVGQDKYKRVK